MKKLLFFDIDGTIITEGAPRIIPDSIPKTLQLLRANGHLCFVNTGRAYAEIEDNIRRLPFDGYICGCGTHILYHDKELFHQSFPNALGRQLLRDMDELQLEWLLEAKEHVYYHTGEYRTRIADFRDEHQRLIPAALCLISPQKHPDAIVFDKFCICLDEASRPQPFFEKYNDLLSFIDRGNSFYEVVPKGCSKASGIQFLEQHFSIANSDTIAIGDSANDLPMLEYAGYSIAMGNCSKELPAIVDTITDTVERDGVYKAMQRLGLL